MTQEQLKMRVIKTLGLVLAGAAVLWAIWLFGVRGSLVAGLDPGAARGVEFFAALGITFLALLAPAAQLLNMIVKDRSGLETEVEKTTFLYRMIVEKSNDIILEIDEKGDVAFANPAVILLGYEPEKLIGRPVKQLIPEKDRQEILPIITTRRIGPRATINHPVTLLTAEDSVLSDELLSMEFLVDASGLWKEPDEIVRIKGSKKTFLGTLFIARVQSS